MLKSNLHDERTARSKQLRFGMQIANWWRSFTKSVVAIVVDIDS